MNTFSTDLPTEVSEHLQTLFAAGQTTLRQREEDAFVATLKAEEEQTKKHQAEWAGALMLLKNCLPEWIHKYIQEPTTEYDRIHDVSYETYYNYVTIEVPGCYPITAWAECRENSVRLEAMRPELYQDEDGAWTVVSKALKYRIDRYDIQHGNSDIAVALFQAHEAFLQSLDLAAEAEQRNSREAAKADEPLPPAEPDNVDKAGDLLAKYNVGMINDATIVIASQLYAIADQARRIADALEK